MSRYLVIALSAVAAVLLICFLISDRGRMADELKASRAEVTRLQADAEFAAQTLAARDALDRKFFQEMSDAKQENESLRADVAAGNKRVLVKASCPKPVPGPAGATGLDDGAGAELTADARQDYFDLREQIVETEKQLSGLQEYVRTVVQVAK
ncbi:lysis protein [Pseudomonas putida]|uniref:lysis protein n=1 Tax=Pseudomonas putida TaxID=303 RepID=UPI00236367DC|nr:lysis protein [Pseudomonas putida]MDD2038739.1 lysis protein [Pseudomonas putida]MDD2044316.1 lysis protein [Pseudomonas putida]